MSYEGFSIQVDNINKHYHIFSKPSERIKQLLTSIISRVLHRPEKRYFSEFQALKDISFKVSPGETLGIIGKNGSGKSTLLQIICGTLSPTSGALSTHGRIGALLELGSGFNPEFTGRENVYLNGAILGLSREEIHNKFDSIINFADIGEFINRPVKTYSSGMIVRLAFAVQAQIDPDILVVDEALAVGDAKFQAKCFERLRQLKENGTSILLVTHSAEQIVSHCDRALLLDEGKQIMVGKAKDVVNHYLDLIFGRKRKKDSYTDNDLDYKNTQFFDLSIKEDIFHTRDYYNSNEYRWGDGSAKITDFELLHDVKNHSAIESGSWIRLRIAIRFEEKIISPILGVTVKTKEGVTVFGTNTINVLGHNFEKQGGMGSSCIVSVDIRCALTFGDYFISLGLASKDGEEVVPHDRRYDSIHFQVGQTQGILGVVNLDTKFNIE
jgi:lipopolysaccharide transport system ATP-binding protein